MSLKEKLHNKIYLGRYESRNASPSNGCCSRIKRFFSVVAILGILLLVLNTQVQGVLALLHAPNLPELQTVDGGGKALAAILARTKLGGNHRQGQ